MKIDLNYLKNCVSENITLSAAILLLLIYEKDFDQYRKTLFIFNTTVGEFNEEEFFGVLQNDGYIKITGDNIPEDIVFRDEFLKLLPKEEQKINDLQGLVDAYMNLFPKGVKSGGYYVRSDATSIENAFKRFFKKYTKTTKEQILLATNNYISECKKNNWQYMKCADYFIMKTDKSTLAAYIANIGTVTQETKKDLNQSI